MSEPLVIWRLTDGKPGHMQQTLGLVKALERLHPCEVIDIDLHEQPSGFSDVLLRRFPAGFMKRRPGLVVGAGHSTHFALLAAKRITGAVTVVMMKPSLPRFLFDYVVVPEHDEVGPADNVIITRGVLNAMRPGIKHAGSVLALLGGESKHAGWEDSAVMQQLEIVAAGSPGSFRVADSRRTPESMRQRLATRFAGQYQPWEGCPSGWLAEVLAETETVWVTEDSVSMVYESLTAGCRVGLLKLPDLPKKSRVMRGVERLVSDGLVTRFSDWYSGQHALQLPPVFNEADRAAVIIARRLQEDGRI